MRIRLTEERDLVAVKEMESAPEARLWVYQWTEAQHRALFSDLDSGHWMLEDENGTVLGYCIMKGLNHPFGVVELMRIVVGPKGKGHGRAAVLAVMEAVFDRPETRKLWLDVAEGNARAIHLYESIGFIHEGTLRESALFEGKPVSMELYGMLRREYAVLKADDFARKG